MQVAKRAPDASGTRAEQTAREGAVIPRFRIAVRCGCVGANSGGLRGAFAKSDHKRGGAWRVASAPRLVACWQPTSKRTETGDQAAVSSGAVNNADSNADQAD
jgi:hypothetical protein